MSSGYGGHGLRVGLDDLSGLPNLSDSMKAFCLVFIKQDEGTMLLLLTTIPH